MNKKENRMAVRQEVQKSVIRDEQNRRIQFAATNPINEVLKNLHTTLRGLDEDAISVSRAKFGSNKVTHEKKKSLAKRLAGAFINPFSPCHFPTPGQPALRRQNPPADGIFRSDR